MEEHRSLAFLGYRTQQRSMFSGPLLFYLSIISQSPSLPLPLHQKQTEKETQQHRHVQSFMIKVILHKKQILPNFTELEFHRPPSHQRLLVFTRCPTSDSRIITSPSTFKYNTSLFFSTCTQTLP